VDTARIYALANGIAATGTRDRLLQASARLGVPPDEAEAAATAFEFLQMLRLRSQLDAPAGAESPNRLQVDTLNRIDARILKEALRIARGLQQRLQLDYDR